MILTDSNYFSKESSQHFMSVSQYKSFQKCEAKAMAEITGEYEMEKTTALMVGSYVDRYFEGTLDKFREENPQIFKKDGTLKSDYAQADTIIQRIEADKLFMEYMSGGKQVIETANLFGCDWKIKIDSLCKDKIVDLKVMRSLERVMGRSFIEYWGYDIQMAVYGEIHRICTGENLETYLAVATKEEPANLEIIHIPMWRRQECLEEVRKNLPRILAVKSGEIAPERCGVCEYCRGTKVLTEAIDFDQVGFSNREIKAMKGEI